MLSLEQARDVVTSTVCSRAEWLPQKDDLVILDDLTIEKPWGWVFFLGSRLWHETQDIKYAIAGNAPLLVEKQSGRVLVMGTARATEQYIERYEKTGDPHG
jgi:hypothetical protein